MTMIVVDTNVAIVANGGKTTNADLRCQLSCTERLEIVVKEEVVALDNAQQILTEYGQHLSFSGRPGVGDMFFKYVFDNQHQEERVQLIAITECEDADRGYEELPRNKFDPSDRKFLAVAVVSRAVALNATDSDWGEEQRLINELKVEIEQLCPHMLRERQERRG